MTEFEHEIGDRVVVRHWATDVRSPGFVTARELCGEVEGLDCDEISALDVSSELVEGQVWYDVRLDSGRLAICRADEVTALDAVGGMS